MNFRCLVLIPLCCSLLDRAQAVDAIPAGELVDLTWAFDETTVYWPTADSFAMTADFKGMTEQGFWYEANTLRLAEHGGTHLDAPVHFAEGAHSTDRIPLERLIGPAIVVDVMAAAAADRDYQVSLEDLQAWEAGNGRIPDGVIVLLRTGFGAFWPDRERYLGTDELGADAVANLHFPGLHPKAAQWLVENRSIHALGVDTPSIDYGQSTDFLTHRILFSHNIPAFENLANLERLPLTGAYLIALPMKIGGGSGGPLRAVAVVP